MADLAQAVQEHRSTVYRQSAHQKLHSEEEALHWINHVGLCLLFSNEKLELPDLARASEGKFRRWKDRIAEQKQAYYGRPFRRRSGFVALSLVGCLYALSPTGLCGGDRFELYRRRYLSADANRIVGIVLAKGPLPTRALRRESGMASASQRYRFVRAMIEAQERFLISRAGITHIEASHYSCLWDSFARHLPDCLEQGLALAPESAASTVLRHYIQTVGATTHKHIAAAFALKEQFTQHVTQALSASGEAVPYFEHGIRYLVHPELHARLAG